MQFMLALFLCQSLCETLVFIFRLTPHEIVADLAVSWLAKFPAILGALLIALGKSEYLAKLKK